MRFILFPLLLSLVSQTVSAQFRVFPQGKYPSDSRLGELRTLNSYFPLKPVENKQQWQSRQAEIKRRLLISQGLWPQPAKTKLHAVVHGRVEHDDYTIDRVYFQSVPGHFVTGSLYRPKGKNGPFPAVLCPHGHWKDARFYDAGEAAAKNSVAVGAERYINAARNHIQARCVQLARMGCIAFFYDMTGNCDSIQIGHRPDNSDHLDTREDWGFFSVQAELRLINMMGLQTWNSVRSIDFLLEQPDVDAGRIGVTGASGGGTQSMIIAAIDDRVTAAMPCVMVSTSMQGGCTCENAPLMRIDQGNIDIAAAIAPRPLGLTAANDWTVELKTKGYPALQHLYAMLGQKKRLTAVFHTHFPHNYNHVNRTVMYGFINRHFKLGFAEPVLERDFDLMSAEQLTVWNEKHPAPSGNAVGDPHEIALLKIVASDSQERISATVPDEARGLTEFRYVLGGVWETIIGRRLDQVGDLTFTQTRQTTHAGFALTLGHIDHAAAAEQIPVMRLQTADSIPKGVVVWISEAGKTGLIDGDEVIAPVAQLLNAGYSVISADLSGQGEFLADGINRLQSQRMWYQQDGSKTWQRFSGYTYGYNHSLFAKRCHDALTLIKHAKEISGKQRVLLVGLDTNAGPIALAARGQSGDAISHTIVDLGGFQFQEISKHDDPMFVPGAVKYLDVDGLLSLCAPHRVTIAGIEHAAAANHVYAAADAADRLNVIKHDEISSVLDLQARGANE